MAKIQGITIEIGGDTTKLQKSLNQINAPINKINSELTNLQKALKLDPKNTELLAQKQEVLKRNIEATTQKLNGLIKAQQEMGDYNSLTEEQKATYNRLSLEIAKSKNALAEMNEELGKSSKIDLSKVANALKKVGDVAVQVAKKMAQVTAAIGGALAGLVTMGVKSYSELEQNLGGVETLFGKSADKVIANAKRAYATAGVSANEYMAGVTSFSASLLQSLGGNTEKAAEVADMAFRDMSDNANKFGTDMQSIQNAYQGFSKQQYQLLDNLKLGYGGTKTEMQRLLKDAQKITGIKYDINNLSDVYSAIHVIQKELGVTGTTAEEAEKTIGGSINSMKAAFDNFLNGSGSPEDLAKTINNVFTNIAGAVMKLAPSILSGVVTLVQTLLPQIVTTLISMLPQLLDAITNLIDTLFTMVSQNTEQIRITVTTLINKFVEFVTTNLPTILNLALTLILTLAQGIADALKDPTFMNSIVNCVLEIVNIITDNLDLVIDVSLQLILALTDGLLIALPQLASKVPEIVDKIVTVIMENLPKIADAAWTITLTLGKALIQNLPTIFSNAYKMVTTIISAIVKNLPQFLQKGKEIVGKIANGIIDNLGLLKTKAGEVISKLVGWLKNGLNKIKDVGKDLINGMWNGIQDKWNGLKDKVEGFGKGIVGKFKKVFGIASPSKVFKNEIGKYLAEGVGVGFTDTMEDITGDMTNAIPVNQLASNVSSALRSLNAGIESSVNPTINPSVAYENNYTMMASIFRDILGEMKIELDDREMGKFIDKTVANEVFN